MATGEGGQPKGSTNKMAKAKSKAKTKSKSSSKTSPNTDTYRHPEAKTLLRPDVGAQAHFNKKKPLSAG